jgi:hypothetical protein
MWQEGKEPDGAGIIQPRGFNEVAAVTDAVNFFTNCASGAEMLPTLFASPHTLR